MATSLTDNIQRERYTTSLSFVRCMISTHFRFLIMLIICNYDVPEIDIHHGTCSISATDIETLINQHKHYGMAVSSVRLDANRQGRPRGHKAMSPDGIHRSI